MEDAEYLFKQTEIERKRIGRGDFNKKRQGGKTVRFPSDYLTAKERLKMNGELKTFNLTKPTTWESFKQWPVELKCEYIRGLESKYEVSGIQIAEMLGVHYQTFKVNRATWGCPARRGGSRGYDKVGWQKFCSGEEELDTPVEKTPEAPVEAPAVKLPQAGLDVEALIRALVGSGAKLKIEVTL